MGSERLLFALLLFVTIIHINACLWVFIAKSSGKTTNWIEKGNFQNAQPFRLYIASFYFVVTTITTVGYGDISGTNSAERMFGCLLMIIGVLAFSFSTGQLSSIMATKDSQTSRMIQRMRTLNEIDERYNLPTDLLIELRKVIK